MDATKRFSDRARKVLALANQEAHRLKHEYIGTEHILLGLVKEGSGVGANILKNLGVDLDTVRFEIEQVVNSAPDPIALGGPPQARGAKKAVEYALEEARDLHHNYVGIEHLLLGPIREHDGIAGQVLRKLNVTIEAVRDQLLTP